MIDQLLRCAANREGVISFAGGLPAPETFPHRALERACSAAIQDTALQYAWPEGRPGLREAIAARMRQRGAGVLAEDVIITNGAQDALAIAVEVLGALQVHVDAVTYPGALDIFEHGQCEPDATAPHPVVYVMPAVSNPRGALMGAEERRRALQAQWIIEDDAYGELLFHGPAPRPLIADAPDRVFFIGTFSKTIAPGLRVGWLIAPPTLRAKVREMKARRDLQACGLSQAVVERLLGAPDFEDRLEKLRAHYCQRSERLLTALVHLPGVRFSIPAGGFSVWVETDLPGSDAAWLYTALEHGVAFDPGDLFRAHPTRDPTLSMRLSFSAVPMDQIEAGVARLDQALRARRHHRHAA